jgi:hypothetical protein
LSFQDPFTPAAIDSDWMREKKRIEDREELKQRSPDCGIFKTDCILTFAL